MKLYTYKTNVQLLKILRLVGVHFLKRSIYTNDAADQQCEYNWHRTVYHLAYILLNATYLNIVSCETCRPEAGSHFSQTMV